MTNSRRPEGEVKSGDAETARKRRLTGQGLQVGIGSRQLPSSLLLGPARFVAARTGFQRIALAIFLGVLGALAQAPIYALPLLFVSVTGLVWMIDALGPYERRLRMSALIGWAYGFGFFAATTFWVGNSFLVDAAQFGAIMPVAMGLLFAGLALFPMTGIVLVRMVWNTTPARIAALALGLALAEYARGQLFTGFPWANAGYAFFVLPELAQGGSLVGVYGLSFIAYLTAGSPAALIGFARGPAGTAGLRSAIWPLAAICLLAGLWGFGAYRLAAPSAPETEGVRLRLVQASTPQAEKIFGNAEAILARNLEIMKAPGLERITHVVWPEAAVPVFMADQPAYLNPVWAALRSGQTIIFGSARFEPRRAGRPDTYFNSAFVMNSEGRILGSYDKHHLVPFGEYLPLQGLLSSFGLRQIVENSAGYTPGPGLRTLQVPGLPDFGILICYEAIFPGRVTDPAKRPSFLVNLTDDTWFGDTSGPRQHFDKVRMRAIEEGIPIVRAANNGISAVIDGRGRIIGRLDLNAVGHLDAPLPKPEDPTLYAWLGDLPFVLMLLLAFAVSILARRQV